VIKSNKNRPRSVASVLCNYLLAAFDPEPRITRMVGCGLPADTVSVHRQDVVLSFTCLSAPHFRAKVRAAAQMQSRDVVLVRSCRGTDVFPVLADVTLCGGGLAGFDLYDLELYRHQDQSLWLVPPLFSAAVLLSADGLILQMVPPYSTVRQRAAGIYRATAEIAAEIFPQVAQ
jgi:hypothetical protein